MEELKLKSDLELSDDDIKSPMSSARSHLSAKGQKMADSIGEYILLNYFFPDVKDRKK